MTWACSAKGRTGLMEQSPLVQEHRFQDFTIATSLERCAMMGLKPTVPACGMGHAQSSCGPAAQI